MNSKLAATYFLILVCFLSATALAQQDFSADIVNTDQDKHTSNPAKMYVAKDKMRFESQERNGRAGAVIMNFATQTSTVLMPEQKMYMELSQGQGLGAQRTWNFFRPSDVENACSTWQKMETNRGGTCKKIGHEAVNGRSTVKYEGTSTNGETSEVWLDPKLAFPVKWQGKSGGGELQNIKEESQPSSLFEIPAGYKKMELPMGMPNTSRPH